MNISLNSPSSDTPLAARPHSRDDEGVHNEGNGEVCDEPDQHVQHLVDNHHEYCDHGRGLSVTDLNH